MDDYATAVNIEHPVIGDSSARIKWGFHCQVEAKGRIRDFDYQSKIVRLRNRVGECAAGSMKHDHIRLWFVNWVVGRRYIDRRFGIHSIPAKDVIQPNLHPLEQDHLRSIFWRLLDQFPFDKLKVVVIQDSG